MRFLHKIKHKERGDNQNIREFVNSGDSQAMTVNIFLKSWTWSSTDHICGGYKDGILKVLLRFLKGTFHWQYDNRFKSTKINPAIKVGVSWS